VTEVVFEVVALGFQCVDVLVLDLPPTSAGGHDLHHVLLGEEMAGDEGWLFVSNGVIGSLARRAP
jgi:hypothetical protein